jgi:hypothetical protein
MKQKKSSLFIFLLFISCVLCDNANCQVSKSIVKLDTFFLQGFIFRERLSTDFEVLHFIPKTDSSIDKVSTYRKWIRLRNKRAHQIILPGFLPQDLEDSLHRIRSGFLASGRCTEKEAISNKPFSFIENTSHLVEAFFVKDWFFLIKLADNTRRKRKITKYLTLACIEQKRS